MAFCTRSKFSYNGEFLNHFIFPYNEINATNVSDQDKPSIIVVRVVSTTDIIVFYKNQKNLNGQNGGSNYIYKKFDSESEMADYMNISNICIKSVLELIKQSSVMPELFSLDETDCASNIAFTNDYNFVCEKSDTDTIVLPLDMLTKMAFTNKHKYDNVFVDLQFVPQPNQMNYVNDAIKFTHNIKSTCNVIVSNSDIEPEHKNDKMNDHRNLKFI